MLPSVSSTPTFPTKGETRVEQIATGLPRVLQYQLLKKERLGSFWYPTSRIQPHTGTLWMIILLFPFHALPVKATQQGVPQKKRCFAITVNAPLLICDQGSRTIRMHANEAKLAGSEEITRGPCYCQTSSRPLAPWRLAPLCSSSMVLMFNSELPLLITFSLGCCMCNSAMNPGGESLRVNPGVCLLSCWRASLPRTPRLVPRAEER